MRDKAFTDDNEIISHWIKRALLFLAKTGIVFIAAFIVFAIMTTETILTSNRLEEIEDDTYEKYKNTESDYGISAVIEIDGESVVCLGLETILKYDDEYQSLLNMFEDKIWADQGYILYIVAALAISPICIICIKNKRKKAARTIDIRQIRKASISIIVSIMIGGISLYTAQHITYYVNRQINIGKIDNLAIEFFFKYHDKDFLKSIYVYKSTEDSYDLKELNIYAVYLFDYKERNKDELDYSNCLASIHVDVDKTGEIRLFEGVAGGIYGREYDTEHMELVKKLD